MVGLDVGPRYLATAYVSVPAARDRLRASLSARYVGSQQTVGGLTVRGNTVTDLTVLGTLNARLTVTVGVYNAFDASYGDPAGSEQVVSVIPQNRRNMRLTVQARF